MPYITDKDFKKLASAIADDLIQGQVPLNDSVIKLARDMEMSQEQIRRLCEATNNVTFNKMFNSREKTAQDRMIEFPVADSKIVLAALISDARGDDGETKTAAYELRSLDNEMDLTRRPDAEPTEAFQKTAFELRPTSKVNKEADVRTLSKVLDHMRSEKLATDMQYSDTLNELRGRFRRLYDVQPFEVFEKDAAALFGPRSEKVLNDLRSQMGLAEAVYDFHTICKTAGYVDDSTVELQLFDKLIKTASHSGNLSKGIAKIEASLCQTNSTRQ